MEGGGSKNTKNEIWQRGVRIVYRQCPQLPAETKKPACFQGNFSQFLNEQCGIGQTSTKLAADLPHAAPHGNGMDGLLHRKVAVSELKPTMPVSECPAPRTGMLFGQPYKDGKYLFPLHGLLGQGA